MMKKKVNEIKKHAEEKVRDMVDTVKDDLNNKIDDSRTKTIETLGIFVALFTFVSLQFQAFSVFNTFSSITGATLIILGALVFFVIILDLVVQGKKSFFAGGVISGIIFCAVFLSVGMGVKLLLNDTSDIDDSKYYEKQEVNFNNFQNPTNIPIEDNDLIEGIVEDSINNNEILLEDDNLNQE